METLKICIGAYVEISDKREGSYQRIKGNIIDIDLKESPNITNILLDTGFEIRIKFY